MKLTLPPYFFGVYLILFVFMVALSLWRPLAEKIKPVILFSILYWASLLFALAFVVSEAPRAEAHFVEIGQYYPLNRTPAPHSKSSPPPMLTLGDVRQNPDYIIDVDCKQPPCFQGRIDLWAEQTPDGPDKLTWQASIPSQSRLQINGKEQANGTIEWNGNRYGFPIVWTPPPQPSGKRSRLAVELNLTIELQPDDSLSPAGAAPRIIIEHSTARPVGLAKQRQANAGEALAGGLPPVVYLTSSTQSVALRRSRPQEPQNDNYIPTIKISAAADLTANIHAFLTRPSLPEEAGADFVVNTGLVRSGNPFGERIYIGAQQGIVATVVSKGGWSQALIYAAACVLLWLPPFYFLWPLAGRLRLYAFAPAAQMLLAVRFVLSLRAYLHPPYNTEAIEEAVFALLFVPLLLHLGCYAKDLHSIGEKRQTGASWGDALKKFQPAAHYLLAIVLLPLLFLFLSQSTTPFRSEDVLAFKVSGVRWLKYELALIGLPLLFFLLGLLIDFWLRERSPSAEEYTGNPDDPLIYSLTKRCDRTNESGWLRQHTVLLFFCLSVGGLVFIVTQVSNRFLPQAAAWLVTGAVMLVWWRLLRRLRAILQPDEQSPVNHLLAVAVGSLATLVFCIGWLFVVRACWNLLIPWLVGAPRARMESLLPVFPLRTTTFFEFLILGLTVRLLTSFFERWKDAETPFGWRGLGETALVFLAPPTMLFVSLLASNDTGALPVHGPAMIGATLLITGLWPLWKWAAGRREALWTLALTAVVLAGYYGFAFWKATTLMPFVDEHSMFTHRALLLQGTETASEAADVGGRALIGAIEQHWRMLNYTAEGGWTGRGFGEALMPPGDGYEKFRMIALDDMVFAAYVLAEYGALGGWALLALYLTLFLLVVRMAWEWARGAHAEQSPSTHLARTIPLRLALIIGLVLMLVFPALYMAAANVNQVIFTGQVLPLLGLRSLSDVVRGGMVVMLLMACLQPLTTLKSAQPFSKIPAWWKMAGQGLGLWRYNRERKGARLNELEYDPRTADAALATNLALVGALVIALALAPFIGVLQASNNEEYKRDLPLDALEKSARDLIENRHIWFEPVSPGTKAGLENCRGGAAKNTPAEATIPLHKAYQLCLDDNVKGAAKRDTFTNLAQDWNNREERGNLPGKTSDLEQKQQFFQLDLEKTERLRRIKTGQLPPAPLTVNPYKFQWRSPFRNPSEWKGLLTEAEAEDTDGGALVGAGVVLPLRAAKYGERPIRANTNYTTVRLGAPQIYRSARSFAVYEPQAAQPLLFKIETVSGVEGALLSPEGGAFDLFLNGCPLVVDQDGKCEAQRVRAGFNPEPGTAPKLRLEDGDVICYATRDNDRRRSAKHIFVYSQAQLGAFSYIGWVNGVQRRFYPQSDFWPLGEQISEAIGNSAENRKAQNQNVAITVHAGLNREVHDLLRKWRACLDGQPPPQSGCAQYKTPLTPPNDSRQMAVTLMDAQTGALLALASDHGVRYRAGQQVRNQPPSAELPNLNFTRHNVGSAIKPFIAAATLSAFPGLIKLRIIDDRQNKTRVFGWPLGKDPKRDKEIVSNQKETSWDQFLPPSDNLYAVTLGLLGLCKKEGAQDLPSLSPGAPPAGELTLRLTDDGSSWGALILPEPQMADPARNRLDGLERTPLARQLDDLFDVRAAALPQVSSFDRALWTPLKNLELLPRPRLYDAVSPEITNFAFADINDFSKLRSVLLGGAFSDPEEYGLVGATWSNVQLAQSFARLTTGRKVTARIIAGNRQPFDEWFPNEAWRWEIMRGLEGVTARGTAANELSAAIKSIAGKSIAGKSIAGSPPQSVFGSQATRFTVFGKTGTLGLTDRVKRTDDSIFVFTAGIWNDAARSFDRPITGAIYIQQGDAKRAQALAADLLRLLDHHLHWRSGQ